MQEERLKKGKTPNSADAGMALSEFANDTIPGSRSEAVPPKESGVVTGSGMRETRDYLTTLIRNNPGVVAAVGGLLLGFAVGIYAFTRRGR